MNKETVEDIEAVAFAFSVVAFFSVGYVVIRPEYFTLPMPVMIVFALGAACVFTFAVCLAAVIIKIGKVMFKKIRCSFRKHKRMVMNYGSH